MNRFAFTPDAYGAAIAALLIPERLPELGPGVPNLPIKRALQAIDVSPACRAGLWLLHDFFDESHAISQEDEAAPDRNFWHAILHRREPDPANSKYWFRQVGPHPVLKRLAEQAPSLGYDYTNPFDFVDFCERVRDTGTPDEELAKRVQSLEWRLLFDHCYQNAMS